MRNWFASRALTVGAMILVPVLLLAAGWSGLPLLVAGLPWLGLVASLHVAARDRRRTATEQTGDSRRVEEVLSDRVILERTTTAILEDFVHCGPDDCHVNMSRALSRMGGYTGANRCYLYRFGLSGEDAERVLTCQADDDGSAGPPSALPAAEVAQLCRIFEQEPVVVLNDCAGTDHPLAAHVSRWSSGSPVGSCGLVRILQEGRIVGVLGFDSGGVSEWGAGETSLLKLVANLFSAMFARVEAQRCQLEAIESLKASSQAKTDFLANMSHEIRTPLNGVIGVVDLLEDMDLTGPQREYVDLIRESGTLLMHLVNDVLDLSKIEAGHLEIEYLDTNLPELIEELVGLTALTTQAAGLEIVGRVAADVPERVSVDPGRLRQVLTNLLNNATKFTREGHVYLNVETAGTNGDTVDLLFEVSDTGIGISQDQADRIFEKFTQADTSTTRRFGGTGLGLSICRHLVGLMGGRIEASGVLGEGATFSVTLPLAQLAVPVTHERPAVPHRVLLATGHEIGGRVLAEQIRNLGHHCEVAASEEEARELLAGATAGRTDPWSRVILDPYTLPEAMGTIPSQVERIPADLRPHLVLLSRLGAQPREQRPGDHQADTTLAKPVRSDKLECLLQTDTDRASGDAEDAEDAGDSRAEGEGPRVLLAEDNLVNQKVASGMLQRLGCTVTTANNGREALAAAEAGNFDLIFMDCQMPEMDGFEATCRIRDLADTGWRVPIIALTANAFRRDREACHEAGMDDFVTKPVKLDQLEEILEKWGSFIALHNGQPT